MKAQLPKSTQAPPKYYLESDHWAVQQKIDGWRMIVKTGEKIETLNRNGDPLQCPEHIVEYFKPFTTKWTFDGELLGDTYYIFDLLEIPTGNIQNWPLSKRYEMLEMLSSKFSEPIELVTLYTEGKEEAFNKFKDSSSEGVVFKLLTASYANRRSSNFLKFKFTNHVDCVVLDKGVESKDNFVLGLYDGKDFVNVGKCSALTGDGPSVKVGDVVQVNVLYVTNGQRLYQPVKPMLRFDKKPTECVIDQLKELTTNKEVLV